MFLRNMELFASIYVLQFGKGIDSKAIKGQNGTPTAREKGRVLSN